MGHDVPLLQANRLWNANQPISTLPVEILACIFEEAVADEQDDLALSEEEWCEGQFHADEVNFTISHVCHRWRAVALATPSLWSNVCAGFNTEPNALFAVLERSRSAPLRMSLDFFTLEDDLDDFRVAVNEAFLHVGHTRTLKIRFDPESFDLIVWPERPTPVEHLVMCRDDVENPGYRGVPLHLDLSETYPQLCTFSGYYFQNVADWTFPSRLTKLCLFECKFVSTKLGQFLQILGSLESLQDLKLSYIATTDYIVSPAPDCPLTSLPNLCSLVLESEDRWTFLSILSHLSLPRSLQTLRLLVEDDLTAADLFDRCIKVALQTIRSSFPPLTQARLSSSGPESHGLVIVEVEAKFYAENCERVRVQIHPLHTTNSRH